MLDIPRIRAITLDLDGTLWPTWPPIRRAHEKMRAWLAERAPGSAALLADRDHMAQLRRTTVAAQPEIAHDPSQVVRALLSALLHQVGADPALVQPAYDIYYQERQGVEPYPDTREALRQLAARWPLVALTNGNADIWRTELAPFFHAAVSAGSVGAAKPDARIFLAGARAAGLQPEQVLHVGDDPVLDGSACHTGMQMAWINRDALAWPEDAALKPHAALPDLAALLRLLNQTRPD